MMFARLACAAIVALAFVWPSPALPEVVELSGGDWVQGALKEVTPAGVVVEVGGQTIKFPTDKVRAIYFAPVQPTAAQAPAAQPAPAQSTPAQPSALGVPPPLPLQSSSGATPSAADVLQVMKSLRSAVQGGIGFREYQARVKAAETFVDRYLAALPGGPESETIHDAVRYYRLAESAWNNQGVVARTAWLRKDDVLDRCSAYRDFVEAMRTKGDAYYAERVKSYVVISDGVIPVLWSCASEKITETETLMAKATK
jgi:hypothetical protein